MSDIADVEAADRIGKRRARIFFLQGLLFLMWQANFFSSLPAGPMRTVDHFKISAWFVWVLALLLLLATGGTLLRRPALRVLLNDELTRQHRTTAYVWGFWAAMGAGVALYVVNLFEPVSGREAIHVVLSLAIAAAILTFARLERRGRAA